MKQALAQAYRTNPELNVQRANTRAVDENTAIARGAFLPTLVFRGNAGLYKSNLNQRGNQPNGVNDLQGSIWQTTNSKSTMYPVAGALLVSLNIFDGFRSINGLNQAEAQARQSKQFLRNVEIAVLHAGAVAYMNLMRDVAIFKLNERYVQTLSQQAEVTRERLLSNGVTQTDLYQAEAALAQAKQARLTSSVNLEKSISVYRQQIGHEPGSTLTPAPIVDKIMPKTLKEAIRRADADHPLALAAEYNVEVHDLDVDMQEGQLLPKVDLTGYVGQQNNSAVGPTNQSLGFFNSTNQQFNFQQSSYQRRFDAGAAVQVNVPLYEGGIVYAHVRQAKEKLAEAKFLRERQIREIHQAVEAAWSAWKLSGQIVASAREQVLKAEAAVQSMRDEVTFGQRTTWDILNAQLVLVNARVALVSSQRDEVISAYSLLAAVGQLSTKKLGIPVATYDANDHYDRVKYQWIGLEPWKK